MSRFRLTMPHLDTELLFDDQKITTTGVGVNREWETPPLERGRAYQYVFTAKWRPNNYTLVTRKKTVQFKGGDAGRRRSLRWSTRPTAPRSGTCRRRITSSPR